MRPMFRSAVVALVVVLAIGAPVAATDSSSQTNGATRLTFDGKMAEATWQSCDPTGCTETTLTVQVGTFTWEAGTSQLSQACFVTKPSPAPAGVFTESLGCLEGATIADDLSSAGVSGDMVLLTADCTTNEGCFGGSIQPVGDAVVTASWTATADSQPFSEVERGTVTSSGLVTTSFVTVRSGQARDAVAVFEGLPTPIGTLISARIASVRELTVRRFL